MRPIAFLQNKYYTDSGMAYVFTRLRDELRACGISLTAECGSYAEYPFSAPWFSHAVFWDKDVPLAKRLQSVGVRLINRAETVEVCDDKEKTFAALSGKIDLPRTVVAPLVYAASSGEDSAFLDYVESEIGYPVVVKESTGSLGQQVFLAFDRAELNALHARLVHKPHVFQRFIRGREKGSDTRVYIVGEQAVGAAVRRNTTDFRSNAALGGVITATPLSDELRSFAQTVARALRLEYGSVDFICENGQYVFIEANSSAYMRGAETAGVPLPALYARYLAEVVCDACR